MVPHRRPTSIILMFSLNVRNHDEEVFHFRITSKSLLDRLNSKSIDAYVSMRQLRWAGHVTCMEMDRLSRQMLS